MRKLTLILSLILTVTFLFPALASGVTMDDLVKRDGLYYEKFSRVPFSGKATGRERKWLLEGAFKDGKKQGLWIGRYKNGQLLSSITYKNGKRHGPWSTYHENGQLGSKGTYKNGRGEGPFIAYHKNGNLWSKGNLKDNDRDGPWVYYWTNGRLWHKGTLIKGKKEGPWVSYEKDGSINLYHTGTYKNGERVK